MPRPMPAAALTALAVVTVVWLLIAFGTAPYRYLVTPRPIYLSGRFVSMLTG